MARIKILLASAQAGGGHTALRDFFYQQMVSDQRFKLVKFDHPGKTLENTDEVIHKFAPMFHELMYFFSPRYISDFFLIGTISFLKECYKILKKEKPQIVLATHFVLSLHFSLAKRLLKSDVIIVNCIPDYGPPSKLMHAKLRPFRADKIMVFDDWTRQGALKNFKMPEKDVLLAGFNPKPIFKQAVDKYETKVNARSKLKEVFNYIPYTEIEPEKTTVLLSSGTVYARKSLPLLKQIALEQKSDLSLIDKFQFFVICGSDTKLYEKLMARNKKFRYWSNIYPFPWVDPQVFATIQYACDFPILGAIAPATLNELLEVECGPFLLYKTRPGQELPHRAFIEEKGLGVFIPDKSELVNRLIRGFSSEEKQKFLNRARAFRHSQSERASTLPGIMLLLHQEYERIYKSKHPQA